MSDKPLRRAQLIAPFGVGALSVTPKGMSLVTAGLDHWFKTQQQSSNIDLEEFRVSEWRLERNLGVNHLRIPPDFRESWQRWGSNTGSLPNLDLTVPAVRFPRWYSCSYCNSLEEMPSLHIEAPKLFCKVCKEKSRNRTLNQVQFVSLCEAGHMDEFPWREWTHRGSTDCVATMKMVASGSGALIESRIVCDCKKSRSIRGSNYDTFLSDGMYEDDRKWLCTGVMPWHGTKDSVEECLLPPRASYRSASNLYFADIKSSISIPIEETDHVTQIVEHLKQKPLSGILSGLVGSGLSNSEPSAEMFLNFDAENILDGFSVNDVQSAINIRLGIETALEQSQPIYGGDDSTFRYEEYEVLTHDVSHEEIMISHRPIQQYGEIVSTNFSKVMMVPRLRETKVLAGFGRLLPKDSLAAGASQKMLWKNPPPRYSSTNWLPAIQVIGEGIFLEFDKERIHKWLQKGNIQERTAHLNTRMKDLAVARNTPRKKVTPELLLVHTFAHLLINRLAFECGYGAASIKERIYVNDDPEARMCGVLLYTSSGDTEGSLGGLVRMGLPGRLEPVIEGLIHGSHWCSNDPVCMEQGDPASGGQGPDNSNLAACYACALVPETSCEEFNRLLDRATISGTHDAANDGYFLN